jgi:ATP synthase protein I
MWQGMCEAWTALSTLIAGIVVWGGIGYGIDRLAGTRPILTVIGVLVGNFGAIYLIYVKYFKQDAPTGAPYYRDAPTGARYERAPKDAP